MHNLVRAAIYARFSTDNQKEASIEDQVRVCRRAAVAAGFHIVATFEDKGISAGTSDRPGYQKLLAKARARAFDIVVVEDISRLWRNRAEYGPRSAELEDLGIHLLTCVGDDTRRDGYGLVLGIKQAIAEAARKEIGYRTRRGMEGLALAGKSTGGRCFGYDAEGKIKFEEAAVIRQVFDLAAYKNMGRRAIASKLNELGIPTPRGGSKWRPSTVDILLNNERYIGRITWGASEGRVSAANSLKKTFVDRNVPLVSRFDEKQQIVPNQVWKLVHRKMAGRTKSHALGLSAVAN